MQLVWLLPGTPREVLLPSVPVPARAPWLADGPSHRSPGVAWLASLWVSPSLSPTPVSALQGLPKQDDLTRRPGAKSRPHRPQFQHGPPSQEPRARTRKTWLSSLGWTHSSCLAHGSWPPPSRGPASMPCVHDLSVPRCAPSLPMRAASGFAPTCRTRGAPLPSPSPPRRESSLPAWKKPVHQTPGGK